MIQVHDAPKSEPLKNSTAQHHSKSKLKISEIETQISKSKLRSANQNTDQQIKTQISKSKLRSANQMSIPRLSPVETTILELLINHNELYGLQLLEKEPKLKRGTIYVTLGRMADKGYVTSRELKDERMAGLPRRLFKITGHGRQVLSATHAYCAALAGGPAYA